MCVLVAEKRLAAVGQRGTSDPQTQSECPCQQLLCDHTVSLSHTAGEVGGHQGTDAAWLLPPAVRGPT